MLNINRDDFIKIRKVHGMNQSQMARIIGVQQSMITKIEKGYSPLTERNAKRLIKYFSLTQDRLSLIRGIYSEFMGREIMAV